jgi:hypothetical protein
MSLILSNVHILILVSITIFLLKNYREKKSDLIFFIIIIFYLINDQFRYLFSNKKLEIICFIFKDLLLLIFTINIIIGKKIDYFKNFASKNFFLITTIFSYLLLNFINLNNKIFFFAGFYDILYFPLIFFVLFHHKFNYLFFQKIIYFIFLIIFFFFIIQKVDLNFYINFFLNNVNNDLTKILLEKKAYNPLILNDTGVYLNQVSSIFNNAGRLNHFIASFYLLSLFLYLEKKNKKLLYILYILILMAITNSSRYTLILILIPTLEVLFIKYYKKFYSKNFKFYLTIIVLLNLLILSFFSFFHENKLPKKIQVFKPLIITYHNFYEPILSSFDTNKKDSASSISGRLLIIKKELNYYLITTKPNFKNIIFGNGIGTHSLSTKYLLNEKKIYIVENSLVVFIFEFGFLGLFILLYLYYKFLKWIKIISKNKYYLKTVFILPLILMLTGYQFYRNYAFQFFFFMMLIMLIKKFFYQKTSQTN